MSGDVFCGRWAPRALFPLDADVTVYWPDVRPCYDAAASDTARPADDAREDEA